MAPSFVYNQTNTSIIFFHFVPKNPPANHFIQYSK